MPILRDYMLYNIFFTIAYIVEKQYLCGRIINPLIIDFMSNKLTKNDSMSKKSAEISDGFFEHEVEQRQQLYNDHLRVITTGLRELALATGRKLPASNQLLRECYGKTDDEFRTPEEWHDRGAIIKRGEHAYLFWDADEENAVGYFCREQVRFLQMSLFD